MFFSSHTTVKEKNIRNTLCLTIFHIVLKNPSAFNWNA